MAIWKVQPGPFAGRWLFNSSCGSAMSHLELEQLDTLKHPANACLFLREKGRLNSVTKTWIEQACAAFVQIHPALQQLLLQPLVPLLLSPGKEQQCQPWLPLFQTSKHLLRFRVFGPPKNIPKTSSLRGIPPGMSRVSQVFGILIGSWLAIQLAHPLGVPNATAHSGETRFFPSHGRYPGNAWLP